MDKTNMSNIDEGEVTQDEELSFDTETVERNSNINADGDAVMISKSKLAIIKKLIENISENSARVSALLSGTLFEQDEARISISQRGDESFAGFSESKEDTGDTRVIEGVFDGENMIGPDGKQYSVPANYASKSKLVEGDILKLTITGSGTFVYKQIGPIDRIRVVGIIEQQSNGNFYVNSEGKKWRVLTASVTYYKGQANDEAVILVPKAGESKWAAVENVVRKVN